MDREWSQVGQETPRERMLLEWEHRHVDGADGRRISLDTARHVVAHAWSFLGLDYPPLVAMEEPVSHTMACATRRRITLFGEQTTCTLLHEVAHSAQMHPDEFIEARRPMEPETHGPEWLSLYLHLLDNLGGPRLNRGYLLSQLPAEVRPPWSWKVVR